jgi:Na+/H+ antiporter NhaD/arsenite permease-like protein
MSIEQILAIIIFLAMFIAIMWGKIHRFIPALIGAAFTAILILVLVDNGPHSLWQVLRLPDFIDGHWWFGKHAAEAAANGASDGAPEISGVNWQTMIFIGGMMVMVEGMGAAGFFRWICLLVARLVKYRVIPILITFMFLSGFLSMFIDSITVMLFLATVTIELARLLKFDPVPVIIGEIFASNTGGSATMSGDPPNIIIGTYSEFNFTFMDFLLNTGVIAWVGLTVAVVLFYLMFRKALRQSASNGQTDAATHYPEPKEAISNPRLFTLSTAIFVVVIVLLVTHAQTGLSVGLIGCIAAALTLAAAVVGKGTPVHIIRNLDWRTLLFFFGLFVCVSGLEVTLVLEDLARLIARTSGENLAIALTFILWLSAFASAIIDNIPFAATMCPVIDGLARAQGFGKEPLAWSLALGTDIGGNGTPIGASANVVGIAIAEKEGYKIGWGRYCKYAFPAMLVIVGLCNLYLVLRYA